MFEDRLLLRRLLLGKNSRTILLGHAGQWRSARSALAGFGGGFKSKKIFENMIEDVCILVVSIPIRLAPNLGACRSELKWVKGSRMKPPRA